MNCIDFFAGIGAWELASAVVNRVSNYPVFRTIEFIEINSQAQKVLRAHFPHIPIYSDVKTYQPIPKAADIYYNSFPCVGTSAAGTKTGLSHQESGLWFESLRCISIGQPKFIIIENPIGLINRGLRAIIAGLTLAGYQAEIEIISASELGAPHQRQRVFIIAYRFDLQLRERQNFTEWSDNIGADIKRAREIGAIEKTKPGSVRLVNEIPPWLGGISFDAHNWANPPIRSGLSPRTPGRRECVSFYGRSIVPLQAAVALMRIQFLASLIE
ncbi:DNA cytosine methyltransferase [Microcoleus sp. A006_D1]|uniref:DNA cytosine methyltransferase n=1 Tax=Microcoleus sp. A006_D1 TaxID=3055267 RepID=UPI002FD46206